MLLLLIIVIADAGRFADTDLWRHVIVGERIIQTHHPVSSDFYTYSFPGHEWGNNSWLADVISALFFDAMGVIGLSLMKLLCSAGLLLLLAATVAEAGGPRWLQSSILLAVAVTLGPFLEYRPQIFSFVLLAALLLLLTRHARRPSAEVWLVIPLMALWTNLHGGFAAGIAALGAYTCGVALTDFFAGRGPRAAIGLATITACAIVATLVNPYGIGSWSMVAHSVGSDEARGSINEWRPLLVAMVNQWHESRLTLIYYSLALGLIALTTCMIAIVRDVSSMPLALVAAGMAFAAFSSVRNLPLALIALTGPLAVATTTFLARRGRSTGETSATRANQGLLAALALFILVNTGFFSTRLPTTIPYPDGAVAFMDSHGLKGNLLNDVNWGGYLLWHARHSKIFVDGRYETAYPASFIRDYLKFFTGAPAGASVLDNYPHDFVLVPPDSGAARLTAASHNWTVIYRDPTAILYARAGTPSAGIATGPSVATKVPRSFFP